MLRPSPNACPLIFVMRQVTLVLLLAIGASASTGCIIHSHDRRPQRGVVVKEKRSCPPAHHWEGGACVHNGKAKGHYK